MHGAILPKALTFTYRAWKLDKLGAAARVAAPLVQQVKQVRIALEQSPFDESRPMTTLPGTWREPHRDVKIPFEQALREWSEESATILEDVARTYGGYITYSELASRLNKATGIHTGQLLSNWSGKLLNRVIHVCLERGLPALSALVVHASDGTVGKGFGEALRAASRDVPQTELERERAAAAERLECYRVYCLDMPVDATAQLTRQYEARVNPKRKDLPKMKAVCPVHGIQLPATGICDDCS